MPDFAEPLARLIEEFKRLPGIGQKSAQRLAFHVLRAPREDAERWRRRSSTSRTSWASAPSATTSATPSCAPTAAIRNRDHASICVVEEPHNILPVETTRQFRGLYHVLHGAISPLRGIGPEQLKIKGLLERIAQGDVKEIILATNPTVEGEATAVYLSRLLKPLGVKVTRIAMGDSGGQRPRVRRRSDDVEVARESARDVAGEGASY